MGYIRESSRRQGELRPHYRGGHIIGRGVMIGDVTTDFATTDDYQASYLITQAANELCPSMIWQRRRSAADYQPSMS
jgi:hypothetical protein